MSDRYDIEAGNSRVTIRATAGGLLSALGHDPTFVANDLTGEVFFEAGAPERSSLRVVVGAASLQLLGDLSEKDRREIMRATFDDVLEVPRYPQVEYVCSTVHPGGAATGPLELELNGQLTLHGMTRPQRVLARVATMGETLRVRGDFSLRQTSWGIRPVNIGGRMLHVKDELNGTFDIVCRRRP